MPPIAVRTKPPSAIQIAALISGGLHVRLAFPLVLCFWASASFPLAGVKGRAVVPAVARPACYWFLRFTHMLATATALVEPNGEAMTPCAQSAPWPLIGSVVPSLRT